MSVQKGVIIYKIKNTESRGKCTMMERIGVPRKSKEVQICTKIILIIKGFEKVEYVQKREKNKVNYRGTKNKTDVVLGIKDVIEIKREPVEVTLISGLGKTEIKMEYYNIMDRLLN